MTSSCKPHLLNGFSVDVENSLPQARPDYQEVARNTCQILQLLSDHDATATFFCVGDMAQPLAGLLKTICREGHEIGVHGWKHERITALGSASFREESRRAKETIEQITGGAVAGYRAPFLSMEPGNKDLFNILVECGFSYNSSVKHRLLPAHLQNFPIFRWQNGLVEVPPTSGQALIPLLGGGYFRHLPLWWSEFSIGRTHSCGRPVVIYTHPYEIEESFPPLRHWFKGRGSFTFHLLQSRNRGNTHLEKLRFLLQRYRFCGLHTLAKKGNWFSPATSGQTHDR